MIISPNTTVTSLSEAPAAPAQATPTPEAPKVPDQTQSLLAAINADREAREAATKYKGQHEEALARATSAEAKLADIEKSRKSRLLDPASYLRKLGYSDKDLALTAEGIMFTLMPEKAPGDHRAKLLEAQIIADREAAEEAQAKAKADFERQAAEQSTVREREIESQMLNAYKSGASTFQPGSYPASQAWFDTDHDGYAKELLSSAREIAEAALRAGTPQSADLSPASVAKHLETKYAERAKRFVGFSQPAAAATPKPSETQSPATKPVETQLESVPRFTDSPRPARQRYSDSDIIARAAAAAFGRE